MVSPTLLECVSIRSFPFLSYFHLASEISDVNAIIHDHSFCRSCGLRHAKATTNFFFFVQSGIFVTVGQVANQQAGPAVLFSFVVAAFASLLSAFCYAEFSARIPVAGSAYTFAYVALGELCAWLIGWNLTLEYAISGSAVAKGWANYVVSFLNVFHVQARQKPIEITILIDLFIFLSDRSQLGFTATTRGMSIQIIPDSSHCLCCQWLSFLFARPSS